MTSQTAELLGRYVQERRPFKYLTVVVDSNQHEIFMSAVNSIVHPLLKHEIFGNYNANNDDPDDGNYDELDGGIKGKEEKETDGNAQQEE